MKPARARRVPQSAQATGRATGKHAAPEFDIGATVTSLSTYLGTVKSIRKQWEAHWPEGPSDIWFRGHKDASWPLVPSLYRLLGDSGEIPDEEDWRAGFYLNSPMYTSGHASPPANDWDRYCLMQHYGMPTRLLDWSESALVAFYFAIATATADSDAAVWVLDPYGLNKVLSPLLSDELVFPFDELAGKYLPKLYEGKALPRPPVALYPVRASRRLLAQRGTFTVHGSDRKSLDQYRKLKGFLVRIRIGGSAIDSLKDELYQAGITEAMLFPELDHLCRELTERF